jgi:glutamate racemase
VNLKIGVFDSGVGGLTVLHALGERIPEAEYLYFGDTARLPYGAKSARTVAKFAIEAAQFLQARGIELLVVACNTATALALPAIREAVRIPVEGVVEPGAERAAAATTRKKVVVIATEATIGSHAYMQALAGREIQVCEKACPLFVPLIEEGWAEHPVTKSVAHAYLDDVFYDYENGPDVLVLGCTHYPLIKGVLRSVVPWRVEIVDSAEWTAQSVARKLGIQRTARATPGMELACFATDSVERFRRLGQLFVGQPLENVTLVDLGG